MKHYLDYIHLYKRIKMKKQLFTWVLFVSLGMAQNINLTAEQEKNWQITIEKPHYSEMLPLGEFVAEVVTPPSLLHTISLPFEANIKQLNVAMYEEVKKDELLAKVTGTEWISMQQEAIAHIIAYRHQEKLTTRKNILCKEKIIPQKECVAANAALEAAKINVSASNALLKSYGASDEVITLLFKELKLSATLDVMSGVDGHIVVLGATPGKSINSSDALFVIQTKGGLWLESDIEAHRVKQLFEGQEVRIGLDGNMFDTKILHISPVINPENQTRQVRFMIPENIDIVAGLRSNVYISYAYGSMKIRKTSVIKAEEKQIVFVKTSNGYRAVAVEILAENDSYYFIKPSEALKAGIASSSVAILKNLLGESDE